MASACLHATGGAWPCRDIDAAGGLDKYLVQMPLAKLDSDKGFQLRQRILAARRAQQQQRPLQGQQQQQGSPAASGQG